MNNRDHFIVAVCAVILLAIFLPHFAQFTDAEKYVLFVSLVVFSSIWTPDIDLKLPFINHRGVTHTFAGIIVIAAIIWAGLGFILNYIGQSEIAAFTPFVALGFTAGWLLHVATDYVYDRIRKLTWVVLMGIMFAALYIMK